MSMSTPGTTLRLDVQRTYPASRERTFRAWTDPDQLKKWFAAADGYTTPIAEIDLRVGGSYRLGMQPPNSSDIYIVHGVYREIRAPEKIVFTWRWESAGNEVPDTLVTVQFFAYGDSTKVVITHEGFANTSQHDQHAEGWRGCLNTLDRLLREEAK
jgi:uncharacterized protein YndB with AHSA1/START domain